MWILVLFSSSLPFLLNFFLRVTLSDMTDWQTTSHFISIAIDFSLRKPFGCGSHPVVFRPSVSLCNLFGSHMWKQSVYGAFFIEYFAENGKCLFIFGCYKIRIKTKMVFVYYERAIRKSQLIIIIIIMGVYNFCCNVLSFCARVCECAFYYTSS